MSSFEISYLSLVLSLVQVMGLLIQHRIDPIDLGIRWWSAGICAIGLSFTIGMLGNETPLEPFAITVNNVGFLGGLLLMHVAVGRFLGRNRVLRASLAAWLASTLLLVYFMFVHDAPVPRSVTLSTGGAVLLSMLAWTLLRHRSRDVAGTAAVLGGVFGATALMFVIRAVTVVLPQAAPMHAGAGSRMNGITLTAVSTFWTLGYLIMFNQRLHVQRRQAIDELQAAAEQIRTLSGIIPICAGCKKIRNDKGYWEQVEAYVSAHTHAEFSHSLCQECIPRLYPELSGPTD